MGLIAVMLGVLTASALAGCQSTKGPQPLRLGPGEVTGVPAGAELVGGGLSGEYRFDRPGMLYLVDAESKLCVWSQAMQADEPVALYQTVDQDLLFGTLLMGRYGLEGMKFLEAIQENDMRSGMGLPTDPITFVVYFKASPEPRTDD